MSSLVLSNYISSLDLLSHALPTPSPGLAINAMRCLAPSTSATTHFESSSPEMTPGESSFPSPYESPLLPAIPLSSSAALKTYPMQTHAKSGIFNPKHILFLSASVSEVETTSYF